MYSLALFEVAQVYEDDKTNSRCSDGNSSRNKPFISCQLSKKFRHEHTTKDPNFNIFFY